MYDFKTMVDRTGLSSAKVHAKTIKKYFNLDYNEDTISLWVSEMDYVMSPEIKEALTSRISKGILGYTSSDSRYFGSVINWLKSRFDTEIDKNWIVYSHGTVPAIRNVLRIFTKENDRVIIQPPVYGQFKGVITETNRKVANNSLIKTETGYRIDFGSFEELAKQDDVKMFILCNPHNPIGEVWERDDLIRLLDISKKYGLVVFADEVHAEIVREIEFTTTAKLRYDNVITALALSKAFNITGLHITHLIIPGESIRERYNKYIGFTSISPLAMEATIASYNEAGNWLDEVNDEISSNFKFMNDFIVERIPRLKFNVPRGTYLAWLDFSDYKIQTQKLMERFASEASLVLESGLMFGKEGKSHARMTIATPRDVLKEVLIRMERFLKDIE